MEIPTLTKEETLERDLDVLRSKFSCIVTPCGSRVTCNPAPTDTDADYLVLVPSGEKFAADIVAHLHQNGWNWDGSEHYQSAIDGFMSWKRDDANLIITSNAHFWERHNLATAVCKELNLMDKKQRIVLFQAILYGRFGDTIKKP